MHLCGSLETYLLPCEFLQEPCRVCHEKLKNVTLLLYRIRFLSFSFFVSFSFIGKHLHLASFWKDIFVTSRILVWEEFCFSPQHFKDTALLPSGLHNFRRRVHHNSDHCSSLWSVLIFLWLFPRYFLSFQQTDCSASGLGFFRYPVLAWTLKLVNSCLSPHLGPF